MGKRIFCCEASRQLYEDYYKRQTGGAIPVFVGARYQRGHGLGSILGGLFRRVVPFIKQNIGTVGKALAKTGLEIAGDVLSGQRVKESLQQRVPEGLKRTAESLNWEQAHPGVKTIGSSLLKTGADIAGDVIGGKKFKEAVLEHGPKGIKRTVKAVLRQKGSGRRRKRHRDIFD